MPESGHVRRKSLFLRLYISFLIFLVLPVVVLGLGRESSGCSPSTT